MIDPGSSLKSTQAIHTWADHKDVIFNVGKVSLFAGFLGGTIAFMRNLHKRHIPFGWPLFVFYASKVGFGCMAAYLALLVAPFFGLGDSVRAEEAIAILYATLGSEFVGLLMRRILGAQSSDLDEICKDAKDQ